MRKLETEVHVNFCLFVVGRRIGRVSQQERARRSKANSDGEVKKQWMNEGDRLRSVFGGVRSIIFLLLRQLYLSYFLMFQLLSPHILFTSFVLSSSSFCVLSHTKIIIGN